MNYLIQKVHAVDPVTGLNQVVDLRIVDGKIDEIGSSLNGKNLEVVEGKGLHLFPGFIDLHTHFREPGFEAKETIVTGSQAALRGGFVASVSMPNTDPPCDQQGIIDIIMRKAKEVPYYIFPAGTITKGRQGKELSEMGDMIRAGIVAVTDDGDWVQDSLLMRRALEYASMFNLIVISHCEDKRLSAKGVMNEGFNSTKLGLRGISSLSEDVAVARDIELARATGTRLHICHVSTARAVELIRRAKNENVRVTADVTPHHLALTDDVMEGYNTNCKINPPLRTRKDLEALRNGLKEGVIDCVATDHAPHTPEEKIGELDYAPFGSIGLETAFGVVLTELYHGEKWDLATIVRIFSARPAEILGKGDQFGCLRRGVEANMTLADLDREWVVHPEEFKSKSRNSCFVKAALRGRVVATLCAGRLWRF